jgi:hypothetical protein
MRINEQIIKKIKSRMDIGAKKYGDTIDIKDNRDFLEEAIEEALDGCVYLAAKLIQIQNKTEESK